MKSCRQCDTELFPGINWKQSSVKRNDYLCKVCRRSQSASEHLTIKLKTLTAYGDRCVCCQECNPIFLTIDHISDNGAQERREINRGGGHHFYHWLKKQGYPKDNYQILCFNCNFAKHTLGICPHQHTK